MPKTLANLRALNIKDIDINEAKSHFDLPIEDLFQTKRDLISALSETKAQLLNLLSGDDAFPVWRGMTCDREWAVGVEQDDDVGQSWAWSVEGALKGSGLGMDGEDGVVVEGLVDQAYIDWGLTIAVNTFHPEEREIVVSDPSQVTLSRILAWPSKDVIRVFGETAQSPRR